MATAQRIYKVTAGDKSYLVQATSQAQALRHIAGRMYRVEIATAMDVAKSMAAGAKLEVATTIAEQAEIFGEEQGA